MGIITESMQWKQWPKNIPRPTEEEYREAKRRYEATCVPGDWTDYISGLEYIMSTCTIEVWRDFFDSLKEKVEENK